MEIALEQTDATDRLPDYAVSNVKVDGTDNNSIKIDDDYGTLSIPASIFEGKTNGASVVITLTLGYRSSGEQVVPKAVQITVTVTVTVTEMV